jgi:hypothetical protein
MGNTMIREFKRYLSSAISNVSKKWINGYPETTCLNPYDDEGYTVLDRCDSCCPDSLETCAPIASPDYGDEITRLKIENEHLLQLIVDIERAIDHGDQQQIAVGIKRLRCLLGTKKILDPTIKPGLVR